MLTTNTDMMDSTPVRAAMAQKSLVCRKGKQKGAVLIVGLILLMVITLLALAGIQGTSLQERMSGNAYDRNIAFNSAEMALRWAENRLLNGDDTAFDVAPDTHNDPNDSNFTDDKFAKSGSGAPWDTEVTAVTPATVTTAPQVTVIDLGDGCFKVNSLGTGRNPKTEVVLQSIVCRDL